MSGMAWCDEGAAALHHPEVFVARSRRRAAGADARGRGVASGWTVAQTARPCVKIRELPEAGEGWRELERAGTGGDGGDMV